MRETRRSHRHHHSGVTGRPALASRVDARACCLRGADICRRQRRLTGRAPWSRLPTRRRWARRRRPPRRWSALRASDGPGQPSRTYRAFALAARSRSPPSAAPTALGSRRALPSRRPRSQSNRSTPRESGWRAVASRSASTCVVHPSCARACSTTRTARTPSAVSAAPRQTRTRTRSHTHAHMWSDPHTTRAIAIPPFARQTHTWPSAESVTHPHCTAPHL